MELLRAVLNSYVAAKVLITQQFSCRGAKHISGNELCESTHFETQLPLHRAQNFFDS